MRAVIQRVKQASVTVDGTVTGSIGCGFLILLGVHRSDTPDKAELLSRKCFELRVFGDDQGKMNRSLLDVNGGVLVVSQFTLYGDCSRGRRPSFVDAAPAELGKALYEHFVLRIKDLMGSAGVVETGIFGASMDVALINDGPVTILIDC